MNEVVINGYKQPVREWDNVRVVTFVDIDKVHDRPDGTTKRNFYNNRKRLTQGTDYYKLNGKDFKQFGDNPKYTYPKGGFVITETGYLMLVKSLNDDLAWEVQRKLVENYFNSTKFVPLKVNNPPQIIENTTKTQNDMFMILDRFSQMHQQLLQSERENNKQLVDIIKQEREANKELREMLKELIHYSISTRTEPEKQPERQYLTANMRYEDWKKIINEAVDKIYEVGSYIKRGDILSEAYNKLNKQYGVVWDHAKKDFYEAEKRSPVNTMELEWWIEYNNPNYRDMLISKLNTIYNEIKKGR